MTASKMRRRALFRLDGRERRVENMRMPAEVHDPRMDTDVIGCLGPEHVIHSSLSFACLLLLLVGFFLFPAIRSRYLQ